MAEASSSSSVSKRPRAGDGTKEGHLRSLNEDSSIADVDEVIRILLDANARPARDVYIHIWVDLYDGYKGETVHGYLWEPEDVHDPGIGVVVADAREKRYKRIEELEALKKRIRAREQEKAQVPSGATATAAAVPDQ